jgi:hypothetical protein
LPDFLLAAPVQTKKLLPDYGNQYRDIKRIDRDKPYQDDRFQDRQVEGSTKTNYEIAGTPDLLVSKYSLMRWTSLRSLPMSPPNFIIMA